MHDQYLFRLYNMKRVETVLKLVLWKAYHVLDYII